MIPAKSPNDQTKPDFKVQPLPGVLGGEIIDFDLRMLAHERDNSAFLRTICEHGVLVFRDQSLTPADFVAVSRFCGDLEFHVLDQYRMPGRAEIYVISNIVENGKPLGNPRDGFGWHTDQSYLQHPTAYTLLYGAETPAAGADTWFCNTYAAYEALDEDLRRRLDGLRGVHSYTYMRTKNQAYVKSNAVTTPLTAAQISRVPDVIHPLIRTHPITDRRGLYLGGDCLAGIEGMSDVEARALTEKLFADAISPRFQYVHKWQPRDVVIWDNRGTMHTATEYDREKFRRLIWRTSVLGEVPY